MGFLKIPYACASARIQNDSQLLHDDFQQFRLLLPEQRSGKLFAIAFFALSASFLLAS
jgi:hypothetical protein